VPAGLEDTNDSRTQVSNGGLTVKQPGWLSIREAAKRYRVNYHVLWSMVKNGVLTRGRFTAAEQQPRIYLKVEELDAWKEGGVDAVRELRGLLPTHELGEAGA
jgi:hypothetical protein